MGTLISIPMYVTSIIAVVCYILTVVKMFKHGDQTYGIISIATLFCGIGIFVMLVLGWMTAGKYGNVLVMAVYTLCLFASPILGFFSGLVN